MSPDLNRRNFLKTAGATGITGLAGCNTLSGNNSDENNNNDTGNGDTTTDTPDPSYDIRASALEYDLTTLATSEADQHDQNYIQENYSAELGITVLNNGEEVGLEELGEIHLENEEGETVETTEEGYVPEYAVEDGQELTVRAEVDGETKTDSVTVNKELPDEFYADARIQEGGETLYDTDWNTPYSFDNHIVDRQAFLDQRAERRDELADDQILTEHDLELIRESDRYLQEERDLDEETLMERRFNGFNAAIRGLGDYEGSNASPNSFNIEQAMLDNYDYRPVFVGGFTNPKEPVVPSAGDGDGVRVESQVAYVDGDWYHVAEDNINARHISEIDDIGMVEEGINFENTSASELGVSVLGEMEEGGPQHHESIVKKAILSPVYAGDKPSTLEDTYAGELELGEGIAWDTLRAIRNNEEWVETMTPLELAASVANETDITDVITASKDQGKFQIEINKEN